MNLCKQCHLGNHEGCTGTLYQGSEHKCECTCEYAPDAIVQAAKDRLQAAIKDYYKLVEPDAYVSDWVLITHKQSIESEAEGHTVIGHLVPTGQAWPMTLGMVAIVHDAERNRSSQS